METVNEAVKWIKIKAFKLAELAGLYKVSSRTMKKWIEPFRKDIGEQVGQFYSCAQVKIIMERLGPPEMTVEV